MLEKILKTLVLLFLVLLAACSSMSPKEERRLSVLRPESVNLHPKEIVIARSRIKKALADDASIEKLRVVQIFSRVSANGNSLPRYRLFDIDPDSIYQLLGLQNADILVGVNDRVVVNPDIFKVVVRYFIDEKDPQIEIERGGTPLLFKYSITE